MRYDNRLCLMGFKWSMSSHFIYNSSLPIQIHSKIQLGVWIKQKRGRIKRADRLWIKSYVIIRVPKELCLFKSILFLDFIVNEIGDFDNFGFLINRSLHRISEYEPSYSKMLHFKEFSFVFGKWVLHQKIHFQISIGEDQWKINFSFLVINIELHLKNFLNWNCLLNSILGYYCGQIAF